MDSTSPQSVGSDIVAFSHEEQRLLTKFFNELVTFDQELKELNMFVIDVYYPGLTQDLISVVGNDVDIYYYYTDRLMPKYGLQEAELPVSLITFLETWDGDFGYRNRRSLDEELLGAEPVWRSETVRDTLQAHRHWGSEDVGEAAYDKEQVANRIKEIYSSLGSCRERLADLIRQT
jgi:hypothetical protein